MLIILSYSIILFFVKINFFFKFILINGGININLLEGIVKFVNSFKDPDLKYLGYITLIMHFELYYYSEF